MFWFFFFNDTATTEIYTLSLHDALPISDRQPPMTLPQRCLGFDRLDPPRPPLRRLERLRVVTRIPIYLALAQLEDEDRKSTRLNSSHANISYAVFCLKKKKTNTSSVSTI